MRPIPPTPPRAGSARPVRVLVVDDSAVVRKLLSESLALDPGIEVIGAAATATIARDMIVRHEPDVLTLDIEMPQIDGLSFLERLMAYHPMPVIVVSSLTRTGYSSTIEALRLGAVDVIAKPGGPGSVGEVGERLRRRIREIGDGDFNFHPAAAAAAPDAPPPRQGVPAARRPDAAVTGSLPPSGPRLIAIGASTGGTQAIEAILTRLPADAPPIAIVQHMPPKFTRAMAERLDGVCALRVIEAAGGERLAPGTAFIAPGGSHLVIESAGLELRTALNSGPPVHYQRPAVDVLFHSVARLRGSKVVALLLTGMGCDGADGLVALRQAGAETIAEDERSCVVFGMPKEAIARGGAAHVATLLDMPRLIYRCFGQV